VKLPLKPPIKPQLALTRKQLPKGEEWVYEPKLDGFRAIVFVDGDESYIQSRSGKPLSRYFPELSFPAGRYVADGELVIRDQEGNVAFDNLQMRLHPAESRINLLAKEIPASFVAFDLLAEEDEKLLKQPLRERRRRLEELAKRDGSIELTPLTGDTAEAEKWLRTSEGVMAKQLDAEYIPGERKGMAKVKRERTIDCVVLGWRPGKEEGTVGSLILGLHDADGKLRVVGHTSGLKAKEKRELPAKLAPYETGERGMGDPSRWNNERELEWIDMRPELVVEVTFDHTSNDRIRHGTKILRWREDKQPSECLMEQLKS
jgi:ATP-dependent DNA ligase